MARLRPADIEMILTLHAEGYSQGEIAREMGVPRSTVSWHVDERGRERQRTKNKRYWKARYGVESSFTGRHRRRALEAKKAQKKRNCP